MNDDNLDALFKALIMRKHDDIEKLRLYKLRDALPLAMRDSPSVLAELILQFDHAQRMSKIARDMEVSASKIARHTMEETMRGCLQEVNNTFSTTAAITIERVAHKVERATIKRLQTEGGVDIVIPMCTFAGEVIFTVFTIYVLNRFGLR